jgi:hypothetical protein
VPGAKIAGDDIDEAADYKHDDGNVQRKYHIGEDLIRERFVHARWRMN